MAVGPTLIRTEWVDFENWTDPVDHLERTYELTGPLEKILVEAYADTQLRVASPAHPHVPTYQPTGRLFRSGRPRSTFADMVWEGTIEYGDAATQVVWAGGTKTGNYATFEAARGGIHDYFAGLAGFHDRYMEAIMDFFDTRRRRY